MRELTPMQAACWFGRSNEAILGGVSAHLYSEFDGQSIDLKKLNLAIQRLYQRHEMLRLRLDRDAIPSIISADQNIEIEVDDFSIFTKTQQKQKLETKRLYWTHQKLDLTQAQTVKFSISLLDEQHFRLHVDADMIAIDPSSFRILMEDLALFYEDADCTLPPTVDFFLGITNLNTIQFTKNNAAVTESGGNHVWLILLLPPLFPSKIQHQRSYKVIGSVAL